jgi:CheY-like chemotaxis protein/nitrogen-specific signal transduction histidine kinase
VEAKNREVEQAKRALEEKAEQLALTSKYKSEFLANMSHELRTPLNSLLILSKLLSGNAQGNLTEKQVEFAKNIHDAGSDLLGLINDILDLSKIEAGATTLDIVEMPFATLREQMERTFRQLAQDKKLDFSIEIDPNVPKSMYTDDKRLQQITKNLLSNAFKFTEKGHVRFKVERASGGWSTVNDHLNSAGQVLALSVEDSGIGIPEDKQRLIFEAFQQADGTTSRKYGGTGLGLSISREITRLLGGELTVQSKIGEGSTFTLYLPLNFSPAAQPRQSGPGAGAMMARAVVAAASAEAEPVEMVLDDRDEIRPEDAVVLIVEDDPRFASILLSLARDSDFKGVVTGEGASVLALAKRYNPRAVMLDIGLPDMDGWALLDLLKRTPETRHIPVHIISADDQRGLGLSMGAFGFTSKPVERESVLSTLEDVKRLTDEPGRRLVVAGAEAASLLSQCFENLETVDDAVEALARPPAERPDCLVVEIGAKVPARLIEALKQDEEQPAAVVLYVPGDLEPEDDRRLRLCVFNGLARPPARRSSWSTRRSCACTSGWTGCRRRRRPSSATPSRTPRS